MSQESDFLSELETYKRIHQRKKKSKRARWLPYVCVLMGLLALLALWTAIDKTWAFFIEKRDRNYLLREFSEADMQDFLTMSSLAKEVKKAQLKIKNTDTDDVIKRGRYKGEKLDFQIEESLRRKGGFNATFKNEIDYYNQRAKDCPSCLCPPMEAKLDSLPARLELYDLDKERQWLGEYKRQREKTGAD